MYDAAYKLLYSHHRMVADLLRGFLPGGAWPGFDYDTLEPLPASHIGRGFTQREGDLMWRLRARAAPDEGWVYVLVLLEFQSGIDRQMALRVLTYTGLAWEGLLRTGKESGNDRRTGTPLPPVIPFVIYNGNPLWTAPLDVSELVAPAARDLARLQPSNQYVLLDMQRAKSGGVPGDNAVALQVALEQAILEESAMPIWRRVETVLAGPEHAGLRQAFAAWLRWSWTKDYGVFADGDGALRVELDRMENAGEVEAMGSLAFERWKERNRKKEAQIFAQGRAEGLEFHRRQLGSQAALRFGADAGRRLSALLADVSKPERLAAVGDAIIECGTGAELLAAAERIVGGTN
ncbi:MAG: Rpn family recombination-promoting nuclease/putative transposase [Rhodospirillaceae bacterium]|nr:Rpn family recombination-promoting nuclease/putative transposase [Rhodospirillaceae bacterium]MDD9999778.1 Rpn family recombination-promoting nuclease/putative transposase [Rhodospirillaceae bacterium]